MKKLIALSCMLLAFVCAFAQQNVTLFMALNRCWTENITRKSVSTGNGL